MFAIMLFLLRNKCSKEEVRFLMKLKNRQLEEDPLNISLSVSLIGLKSFPEKEKNILSVLLLEKYLKGDIPTPGFYFTDNPLADHALDLLMLTNGWRKIIIQDSIKADSRQVKDTNSDIAIVGHVVKPNGKPVKHAKVMLINYKTFSIAKTITDKKGRFTFNTIDYIMVATDTDSLGITATGRNNNTRVKIILDYPFQNKIADEINKRCKKTGLIKYFQTKQYLNPKEKGVKLDVQNVDDINPDFNKNDIKIKDVDVKAKRMSIIPKEIYEKKYISHEIKDDEIAFSATYFKLFRVYNA